MSRFASGKILKLTAKLNPADTTLYADIDVGIITGRLYFVSDLQSEWIDFTGIAASGTAFAYSGLTRGLSQTADPATVGTGKTWIAGSSGTLVAMHDQMVDKQKDNTFEGANTFEDDVTIADTKKVYLGGGTKSYVFSDNGGTDLKFKDENNALRTLSELSSLSGSNDKVKISSDDTTEDYLENKITGGDGISVETTSPAGNEKLDIDIDTSDTVIFSKTSSGASDEDKVPILDSNGQLATGFIDIPGLSSSYTLGENMTAGDQAVLQTDGNIYKWDGYINSGSEFANTISITASRLIYIDTDKVVCAYVDTTNDDLKIRAGTVASNGTITYGIEVTIDATIDAGNNDIQLVKLDTDSGLVMYQDASGTAFNGCPFTVSGTTITAGTPVLINASASTLENYDCCTIDTNKVLFHYASGAGTDCTVRIGTVTANVLTLGTENLDWSTETVTEIRCCKLDTNKALLTVVAAAADLQVAVCTVSGTTITVDTVNKDEYTGTVVRHTTYQVSTDLAVIIFDETDIKSMYISISTTTPTIETIYTILAGTLIGNAYGKPLIILGNSIYGILYDTDKIIWFTVYSSTYEMYAITSIDYGVATGTAINFERSNALPDGKGNFFMNDEDLTSTKTYFINYASRYLLGILQETGTAGQSKQIAVSGQISESNTGLSIGEKYYANYDGTYTMNLTAFSTVQGHIGMIGKALTTTTMLVNIPYEDL